MDLERRHRHMREMRDPRQKQPRYTGWALGFFPNRVWRRRLTCKLSGLMLNEYGQLHALKIDQARAKTYPYRPCSRLNYRTQYLTSSLVQTEMNPNYVNFNAPDVYCKAGLAAHLRLVLCENIPCKRSILGSHPGLRTELKLRSRVFRRPIICQYCMA